MTVNVSADIVLFERGLGKVCYRFQSDSLPDTLMKSQSLDLGGAASADLTTVSRAELLINDSDATYRRGIHSLMAISNNVEVIRSAFGSTIGISGPQHEMMMIISRAHEGHGISVGSVARMIRRTHVFVVAETNKLQEKGLLKKTPSLEDRRVSILKVTPHGFRTLKTLAQRQRKLNDVLFGKFSRTDFLSFIRLLEKLLPSSEEALELINSLAAERLSREA